MIDWDHPLFIGRCDRVGPDLPSGCLRQTIAFPISLPQSRQAEIGPTLP